MPSSRSLNSAAAAASSSSSAAEAAAEAAEAVKAAAEAARMAADSVQNADNGEVEAAAAAEEEEEANGGGSKRRGAYADKRKNRKKSRMTAAQRAEAEEEEEEEDADGSAAAAATAAAAAAAAASSAVPVSVPTHGVAGGVPMPPAVMTAAQLHPGEAPDFQVDLYTHFIAQSNVRSGGQQKRRLRHACAVCVVDSNADKAGTAIPVTGERDSRCSYYCPGCDLYVHPTCWRMLHHPDYVHRYREHAFGPRSKRPSDYPENVEQNQRLQQQGAAAAAMLAAAQAAAEEVGTG